MPTRLRFRFVPMVAVVLAIGADGRGLEAQQVRGVVVDSAGTPVARVRVEFQTDDGTTLAAQRSDSLGRFRFEVDPPRDFRLRARRAGFSTQVSALLLARGFDEVVLTLRLASPPFGVPTIDVTDSVVAVDELKARLAMARTFGGRIIGPEAIARVAGSTRTLADLLRRVGGSAVDVVPASGFQSCFVVNRSSSMRGRIDCAQLVIDDVVVSGDAYVSPGEVDFVVILPVTQAMARFGQRARTGAVLVYTRGSGLPRG